MYRDELEALRKKLSATEAKLAETEVALAAALDRKGVAERLADQPHVAIARAILIGVPIAYVGFAALYYGFFLALLGLGSDGIAAVALLLILLAPMAVLATSGAIGLKKGSRGGWVQSMLAFVALALLFPPLGIYGLWALAGRSTREIIFPATGTKKAETRARVDASAPRIEQEADELVVVSDSGGAVARRREESA